MHFSNPSIHLPVPSTFCSSVHPSKHPPIHSSHQPSIPLSILYYLSDALNELFIRAFSHSPTSAYLPINLSGHPTLPPIHHSIPPFSASSSDCFVLDLIAFAFTRHLLSLAVRLNQFLVLAAFHRLARLTSLRIHFMFFFVFFYFFNKPPQPYPRFLTHSSSAVRF